MTEEQRQALDRIRCAECTDCHKSLHIVKHGLYITVIAVFVILFAVQARCQFPDAPSQTRTADRSFWIFAGINAGATFADAMTTTQMVGHSAHGRPCEFEAWSPTLYGHKANDGQVAAVMAIEAVATTGLAYFLKKKHAHIWKFQLWTIPLAYETEIHARGAIHNLRTCR